jgi:hypothetical protein
VFQAYFLFLFSGILASVGVDKIQLICIFQCYLHYFASSFFFQFDILEINISFSIFITALGGVSFLARAFLGPAAFNTFEVSDRIY